MSIQRVLLVLGCVLLGVGLLSAQEVEIVDLPHDGYDRVYALHVPPSYDPDQPIPLVIGLHGAGGDAISMMIYFDFNDLADETGILVAYPNGIEGGWNYLDEDELHPADLYTDDVDFINTVIDDVAANYNVDMDRIYVVGYSNGGMLVYRLQCEMADRLAGVVAVGALLTHDLAQHCVDADPEPVPVMVVIGSQDQAFPWSGFAEKTEDGRLKTRFSAAQTLMFLATLNGCDTIPESTWVQGSDSPTDVLLQRYGGCTNDLDFR